MALTHWSGGGAARALKTKQRNFFCGQFVTSLVIQLIQTLEICFQGGYSEPVPQYRPAGAKVTAKRESKETPSKEDQRVKRQKKNNDAPRLVFDVATGQVIDEETGQVFLLQPVN